VPFSEVVDNNPGIYESFMPNNMCLISIKHISSIILKALKMVLKISTHYSDTNKSNFAIESFLNYRYIHMAKKIF
jgi:hypothetical protein